MEEEGNGLSVQEFSEKSPDVDDLKRDFDDAKANLSFWMDKAEDGRECRFNEWAGKNDTGKKLGPEAFPWDGSSDLSPQLINPLIEGDVALLGQSLTQANLVAAPVESGDVASAKLVSEFLRWRMGSMEELQREAAIGANYLLQNGLTFFGTSWKRETTRTFQSVNLEEIAQQSPELAMAIQDPEMKDGVVAMFSEAYPKLKKGRINRVIKELREEGVSEIPTEKVVENRPCVKAYELGREIVVDSNVIDLESARAIYCIHYFSPEALKQKVNDGWDSDWIDELLENSKGTYADESYSSNMMTYGSASGYGDEHYDGMVRVIVAYRKEIDPTDEVPVVTQTVFADEVEGAAYHKPIQYDEGRYPFVCITRESLNHRLLDSRGYPELLKDYQSAVKAEMDSRRDRASMSTMPPVEYTAGRKPERIGPGAQIPVRRRGESGFFEIPRYSPASMEVEMQLRQLASRITGRATSDLDAVEANTVRQNLVNRWLMGWKQILKRVWCLDRAYAGPSVWFRVTNNEQGATLIMDETSELYDFNISWNSMNADESKVIEKLDTVGKLMAQYDRSGQARYDIYLRKVIEAIDPNLANQLIAPAQEATDKEVKETSADIAKIASGQVVNAPQNSNSQLRLSVLQQYVQGTEEIPAQDVQERLQQDEGFAARINQYVQALEFQQQQQRNALTGQLGVAPGNVPGSSMAA